MVEAAEQQEGGRSLPFHVTNSSFTMIYVIGHVTRDSAGDVR